MNIDGKDREDLLRVELGTGIKSNVKMTLSTLTKVSLDKRFPCVRKRLGKTQGGYFFLFSLISFLIRFSISL